MQHCSLSLLTFLIKYWNKSFCIFLYLLCSDSSHLVTCWHWTWHHQFSCCHATVRSQKLKLWRTFEPSGLCNLSLGRGLCLVLVLDHSEYFFTFFIKIKTFNLKIICHLKCLMNWKRERPTFPGSAPCLCAVAMVTVWCEESGCTAMSDWRMRRRAWNPLPVCSGVKWRCVKREPPMCWQFWNPVRLFQWSMPINTDLLLRSYWRFLLLWRNGTINPVIKTIKFRIKTNIRRGWSNHLNSTVSEFSQLKLITNNVIHEEPDKRSEVTQVFLKPLFFVRGRNEQH